MQRVVIRRVNSATEQAGHVATVGHARHFLTRLRGLLGKPPLVAGTGLLLTPCSQVHTVGMRAPLDVVFLNADGVVLKCVPRLAPFRVAAARGARHALELASDTVQRLGLQAGDRLRWEPATDV